MENTRRHFIITESCRTSGTRSIFAHSRPRPCKKKYCATPSPKDQSPRCINTWRLMALRNSYSLTAGKGQYTAGQGAEAIGPKSKKERRRKFRRLEQGGSYEGSPEGAIYQAIPIPPGDHR